MLGISWYLISALVALGILIIIHEYGHFSVARLLGVKVLKFSIGFGKTLFKLKDKQGTEYAISWIPLGGYVKMLDERESTVPLSEQQYAFNRQPLYKRTAIVLAGPLANFLLAIFIYWILYMVGIKGFIPIIDDVAAQSPAAEAGLMAGQEIISVDGKQTPTWQAVMLAFLNKKGEQATLKLAVKDPLNHISEHDLVLDNLATLSEHDGAFTQSGFSLRLPTIPAVIGTVNMDEPAAQAQLQSGDQIIQVNEHAVDSWTAFVEIVKNNPGVTLAIQILRDQSKIDLQLTPRINNGAQGYIGASLSQEAWRSSVQRVFRFAPYPALTHAVEQTWTLSSLTLEMIYKLAIGKVDFSNVSGPVAIVKGAGDSAKGGWDYYLAFIAIVSISLAVINLLPIPVLDGGHLFYYLIEFITRRSVSIKFQQIANSIGLIFIITLTFYVIYNDLIVLFTPYD